MIQFSVPNSPVLNDLVNNPLANEPSNNKNSSPINDNISINRINYICSGHRDRHKNCIMVVHKTFLLYSIIQFLELIFVNKRANQIGIVPKELQPSQYLTSRSINTLTSSPFLLYSLCKFNKCQIAEITYRVKLFDKFRFELIKYQIMVDHASNYGSNTLNSQREQVDQWFKIAFEGYNWWDKKTSNNSKRINQYDIITCNIKLKNILKTRKRMETI